VVSTTAEEVQLQQALPLVTDRLSVFHRDLRQAIDSQGQATEAKLQVIETQLATTRTALAIAQTNLQRVHASDLASGLRPSSELFSDLQVPLPPATSEQTGQSSDLAPLASQSSTACQLSAVGAQSGMAPFPPTR
jgi:hypothetical protein